MYPLGGEHQVRFAVRRLPCWAASPHSHGPSDRGISDIAGGVDVGMRGVSAGCAPEERLALARLPVHLFACVAPLRRVRRRYLDNASHGLVFKPACQQTPTGCEDAAIEAGLRRY